MSIKLSRIFSTGPARVASGLLSLGLAGALSVSAMVPAQAAPLSIAPLQTIQTDPMIDNVAYRRNAPPRRHYVRNHRRNNAFPAAVLGLMTAGIGAAIASSRYDNYYGGGYGYPVYGGYGYARGYPYSDGYGYDSYGYGGYPAAYSSGYGYGYNGGYRPGRVIYNRPLLRAGYGYRQHRHWR